MDVLHAHERTSEVSVLRILSARMHQSDFQISYTHNEDRRIATVERLALSMLIECSGSSVECGLDRFELGLALLSLRLNVLQLAPAEVLLARGTEVALVLRQRDEEDLVDRERETRHVDFLANAIDERKLSLLGLGGEQLRGVGVLDMGGRCEHIAGTVDHAPPKLSPGRQDTP